MEVILINISDLSQSSSRSNCCWVRKAKGIAQGWAMHRWFQPPGDLSHSSLHWNQIFFVERGASVSSSGAGGGIGVPGLLPSIRSQRGLTASTCPGDNTCQWMESSTITALLMPARENWQLQPLKSVHNYRGVNSAAWSHIVMTFPNWEMCSAKSHCSQWHLHWSLFMEKRSISLYFLFCSLPLVSCFAPRKTSRHLSHTASCGVWPAKSRQGSSKPHGRGLCLCLPIFHVRWSWF